MTTRLNRREVEASRDIPNHPDNPEPRPGSRHYFCGQCTASGELCGQPATVSYRNTRYTFCEECWQAWLNARLKQWRRIAALYEEIVELHHSIEERKTQ